MDNTLFPYTIEPIDPKQIVINKDTYQWNLQYDNLTAILSNPLNPIPTGTVRTVTALLRHNIGYQYYLADSSYPWGYRTNDCDDLPPPDVPVQAVSVNDGIKYEVYEQPKKMYVIKSDGASLFDFSEAETWRDFRLVRALPYGSQVYIAGKAHHPIPPTGADFYMDTDALSNYNHTFKVAKLQGYSIADLKESLPPKSTVTAVTPPPVATPVPVKPANKIASWKDSYRHFQDTYYNNLVRSYQVTEDIIVRDLAAQRKDKPIKAGDFYDMAGWFTGPDGQVYYRPKGAADAYLWYGIEPKYLTLEDELYNTSRYIKPHEKMYPPKGYEQVWAGISKAAGLVTALKQKRRK